MDKNKTPQGKTGQIPVVPHPDSIASQPTDVTHTASLPKRIWRQLTSTPPKKRLRIVAIASGFVLFAGMAALTIYEPAVQEPDPVPEIVSNYVPPVTTLPSPLTGVEVDPALAERPITAVMIENSIDARPQSGLEQAGMVFEAIAEGGITRFLAAFQEQQPANIGPIRSARPYYVRWAAGLDARYLHSGGSPEGLALIRSLGVKDLDHGAYGERIASRVSTRYAPHNVYTSMDRIDAIGNEAGFTKSDAYKGLERKDPAPSAAPTASTIAMNISGANYNTSYTWRPDTNDYARVMAGIPHTDQDSGAQITPEVVIAMEMSYSIHPNRIHSVYGSVGTGVAHIFQDGVVTVGTWNKPSDTAALTFTDAAGKAIAINRGQTWLTALQAGRLSYQP